jgi:hypothetical protein
VGYRINDSSITVLLEGFVIRLPTAEVLRNTEHIKIAVKVGEASVSGYNDLRLFEHLK